MLYSLDVLARFQILDILPREGTLAALSQARTLKTKLEFTEAEQQEFDIQISADGNAKWKLAAAHPTPIDLTPKEVDLIRNSLSNLSRAGKLRADLLPLCDEFELEA